MMKYIIALSFLFSYYATSFAGEFTSHTGAVIEWKMNEGKGTAVEGTTVATSTCGIGGVTPPVWVTGKNGSGLSYNGGGICRAANSASFAVSTWWTCAWIKPNKTMAITGDRGINIIGQWPVGYAHYFGLRLGYNTSGGTLTMDVNGDAPPTFTGATKITTSTWNCVCAVRIANVQRQLWLNGRIDAVATTAGTALGSEALNIGADENSPNMDYYGIVDDVIFVPRAPLRGEIEYFYAQTAGKHGITAIRGYE